MGTSIYRAILAAAFAALPILASAKDAELDRMMENVMRNAERNRLSVAQAVATALAASEFCPGVGINRRYAYDLTQTTLRPPQPEEEQEIRAKFSQDRKAACSLAFNLYGPSGSTIPGLITVPRGGDFLEEWHAGFPR